MGTKRFDGVHSTRTARVVNRAAILLRALAPTLGRNRHLARLLPPAQKLQKASLTFGPRRAEIARDEPDGKAILRQPRSVKKQFPIKKV